MQPTYPVVRRLLDLPERLHDRDCLISSAGSLSFADTRKGMLRVARWLASVAKVGAGDCVALCLPKSLESVQLIYGIHAAGAAYVPLPHGGPPLRLVETLRAIRPRLLFATPETAAQLAGVDRDSQLAPVQTIEPAPDGHGLGRLLEGIAPATEIPLRAGCDLAAVMPTSGSTGEPKGVMRAHDSVPMRSWLAPDEIRPEDRFVSTSALNYTSSHDIFLPVIGGCSVYLATEREAMFPDRVIGLLEQQKATMWVTTATALRLLLESGRLRQHYLGSLRCVRVAGEPLHAALLHQIMSEIPRARFINIYGATEAPTMLQFEVPRPFPDGMTSVPLGRPSGNFEIRLCNDEGEVVGEGEIGEICAVGGPLMLGYWGDAALTAAKRLPGLANSYRTGDFARQARDGNFYLVGRADDVVKLRGHRFDLGEVEAALRAHGAVREAAAFASINPQGEMEIRAVVLLSGGKRPDAELRRHCAERLPSFARPASIDQFDRFPLLSTGKIDRTALRALISTANTGNPAVRE